MRSTPSCHWCRKSKVKCSLHDGDRACLLCQRAGRPRSECVIEQLLPKTRNRRGNPRSPAVSRKAPAQRTQRVPNVTQWDTAQPQPSPSLDPPPLSSYRDDPIFRHVPERVVVDVVECFRRRFPEMSFLNLADFIPRLQSSPRRVLVVKLAGIFALCIRSPEPSWGEYLTAPSKSQHFAAFVRRNLWPQAVQEPNADMIQCLLLIAQYEWGDGNGFHAWMYTGMAIRMFQGLQAASHLPNRAHHSNLETGQTRETVWKREVQRRTAWACFGMDRSMSSGKDRPASLATDLMVLHLPSGEEEFDLGIPPPAFITYDQLIEPTATYGSSFTISDCFSITIRSLDLWSHVVKWVAHGGRRQASSLEMPPWDPASTWNVIKTEIECWRNTLHDRLKYPHTPLSLYIHRRQGEHFAFINLLHYMSVLIHHREYIPFIPETLSELHGPVEPPLLDRKAPDGWWRMHSATLFDAAAQISSIMSDFKAAGISFMTPIVGYGVFSALSMNVYLAAFPWVDLCSSARIDAARLAQQDFEYLQEFAKIWPLGRPWIRVAKQTKVLYSQINSGIQSPRQESDIARLRNTIEQYGTLVIHDSSDVDEISQTITESSAEKPDDLRTVSASETVGHANDALADERLDEAFQYGSSQHIEGDVAHSPLIAPGQDWSIWNMEFVMFQQAINPFDMF